MIVAVLLMVVVLVALPAVAAWRRCAQSREDSELALELQAFALAVRREAIAGPDPELLARVARLTGRVPETRAFLFALELTRITPALLADTAQRLGLRLRRRVAFERKMLARTRSGLRRAAVAAALPAVLAASFDPLGLHLPDHTVAFLLLLEMFGCCLLWRITRPAV
jgi:hypothetical protein